MAQVLDIRSLSVQFSTAGQPARVLRDIKLSVPRGEIVGIVGESGSGKSTLALAILGLLSANASVTAGQIMLGDVDLLALPPAGLREIRGRRVTMVFQDPMTSFNPVRSIGKQMTDIQFRDRSSSIEDKRRKAAAALTRVGIPDAMSQLNNYPFQFSGGMRQRIAIAMGLLQRPELLIADEETTALDVTLEAQVLHLLRELRAELAAILFISHNLGAVAEICDRVVVLYAGEVVEQGPIGEIFDRPQHPDTRALIDCDPARIAEMTRDLPVIPGDVPNLHALPAACIFAPRCSQAMERCRTEAPTDIEVGRQHVARCHLLVEARP